jgi:hypothetical protein
MVVTRATLTVALAGLTPSNALDVQVYALNTAWDATSATWSAPWTQAGGDVSLDHYQTVRLEAGRPAKELRFDVSSIVQTIAEGSAADNGLILTAAPYRNAGRLDSNELALFGQSPQAALTVSYLDLPARPGQ